MYPVCISQMQQEINGNEIVGSVGIVWIAAIVGIAEYPCEVGAVGEKEPLA